MTVCWSVDFHKMVRVGHACNGLEGRAHYMPQYCCSMGSCPSPITSKARPKDSAMCERWYIVLSARITASPRAGSNSRTKAALCMGLLAHDTNYMHSTYCGSSDPCSVCMKSGQVSWRMACILHMHDMLPCQPWQLHGSFSFHTAGRSYTWSTCHLWCWENLG